MRLYRGLLLSPCLLLVTAPAARGAELCGLEGLVVSSTTGEPLARARVEVSGRGPASAIDTDGSGRFAVSLPADGSYQVTVQRAGYRRRSIPITLGTGCTQKMVARIDPYIVVAGRVLDMEGEPLPEAQVMVVRCGYRLGTRTFGAVKQDRTNDLGQFRLFDLPPGKYLVSASYPRAPVSGEGYAQTYYPGTTSTGSASVLDLRAGGRAEGLDIKLIRTRMVSVRGELISNGELPDKKFYISLGSHGMSVSRTRPEFMFRDVAPGEYTLRASADSETFYGGVLPLLVGNTDIDGIRLPVGPGIRVTGRLRAEGTAQVDFRSFYVSLVRDSEVGAKVQEDGTFVVPDVGPDEYDFQVMSVSDGVYVKSARLGTSDVLHTRLKLIQQPEPLDIVLGTDGGEVEGTVDDELQKPAADALVVLVPADRSWFRRYRTARTNANGYFRIRGLAPGFYRLFSWTALGDNEYYDPDILNRAQASGIDISVTPNGREHKSAKLIR